MIGRYPTILSTWPENLTYIFALAINSFRSASGTSCPLLAALASLQNMRAVCRNVRVRNPRDNGGVKCLHSSSSGVMTL